MSLTASSATRPPASNTAHVSKRKQRRALQLIDWLAPLQLHYPEFESILGGTIEDLAREAHANPEADRQLVLHAIHAGCWTIRDIQDEVRISRKQLDAILADFIAAEIVITGKAKNRGDGFGPPETLYLPAPNSLRK